MMKKYLLLLCVFFGFSCLGAATLLVVNRSSTRQACDCYIDSPLDSRDRIYVGPGQESRVYTTNFDFGQSIYIYFRREDSNGPSRWFCCCAPGEYFEKAEVIILEDSIEFNVSQCSGLNLRTVKVPIPKCFLVRWVNGNWIQSLR